MKIFGMGGLELVIILVVILLIFGPKNLPKLGNALGKTVSNLRAGMNEGKKKKDGEAAEGEAAEGAGDADEPAEGAAAKPAELEGEVELGEPTDPARAEAGANTDASAASVSERDTAANDAKREPEFVNEPETAESSESSADASVAPKKVRRVVKKKVEAEGEPE